MPVPKNPSLSTGLVASALLSALLISLFHSGWLLFGLPFVPFDFFDWLARALPGSVISIGINAMVRAIHALRAGPTSVVAKQIEQGSAILALFFACVLVGGALFLFLRRVDRKSHAIRLGILTGLILGFPLLLISRKSGNTSVRSVFVEAVWVLGLFGTWGAAEAWTFLRFRSRLTAVRRNPEEEIVIFANRIDRRKFILQLAGATASITVIGAMVARFPLRQRPGEVPPALNEEERRWSSTHSLPNSDSLVKPVPGTRPEFTAVEDHYRIDINTTPPSVDAASWKLEITGLVSQPVEFTLEQLRRYPPLHRFVTLQCISNPVGGDLIGTTRWTGVSLQTVLPDLHLNSRASHFKITSVDGFWETVSLEDILADSRIMLTYAWDGLPLPREHGFPLRIYIPDLYGMKQPKWIKAIEVMDHWEPGYWVVRGWDKVARMKATSVIDTVSVDQAFTDSEGQKLIPIGGIAHAGARGIAEVEVSVDQGPWQKAELRTPLSPLTWVLWRFDFPFAPGNHTFAVRCRDAEGNLQVATPAPPDPDGASGIHSVSQRIS